VHVKSARTCDILSLCYLQHLEGFPLASLVAFRRRNAISSLLPSTLPPGGHAGFELQPDTLPRLDQAGGITTAVAKHPRSLPVARIHP
jgi:hypothetical protein